tara:strand:- start:2637 stop:3413 length:777 start_codon:yes stop_codon:yes gene_type:complete
MARFETHMARSKFAMFALIASSMCVISFIFAYSTFGGYEDLDPEQNNIAIISAGETYTGTFDDTTQVWLYSAMDESSEANFTMMANGSEYEGKEPNFWDTTLISEDGERFFTPLTKIGPGFDGDIEIENIGRTTLYLVDMVQMGESLWDQTSVQIMAASCCLAPFLAGLGILGLLRNSEKNEAKPKILVFDQGGIPTTEDLYYSINKIEREIEPKKSAPDPWKVELEEDYANDIASIEKGDEVNDSPDSDDWKGWDEG